MKAYSVAALADICESRREIQNLVGKYSFDILLKEESCIPERYWSSREDICLGLNEGYYIGPSEVSRYYKACHEQTRAFSEAVAKAFPEDTEKLRDEEKFGVGTMDYKPLDTGVIEIAEDGQTAKGIWYCRGTEQCLSDRGFYANWTWGYLAADFVLEGCDWKLWHLLYLEDVNARCGRTWTKPDDFADLPVDERFRELSIPAWPPEPTVRAAVWERYHPLRSFRGTPRIPERYRTFDETFSYGYTGEEAG